MRKKLTALLIPLLFSVVVFAQTEKLALTHSDILQWERITEKYISNDGKFIAYKQEPWKGDPTLKITTSSGEELASIKYGLNARLTADSKFVIYTLKPSEDTLRTLKLKKAKKEDMPENKLVIHNLATGNPEIIGNMKSVKVPEKWAGWIAYQAAAPKDTTETKKQGGKEDSNLPLTLKNLGTGEVQTFPAVSTYLLAEESEFLVFISEGKDSTFKAGVYHHDLKANKTALIQEGKESFKQLAVDKSGGKIVFLYNQAARKKDEPNYSLYYWKTGDAQAAEAVKYDDAFLQEGWQISENGGLSFSESGNRLFFGTAPRKAPKDTTILTEEIPILDIWTWDEEDLQTEQLNNRNRDARKTYLAVHHTGSGKTVQLETPEFTGISKVKKGDGDQFLAWSNRPYAIQSMWEGNPVHNDLYLVDVLSGKAELFQKDLRVRPQVSPEGNYIFWYNAMDTTWNTFEIATKKTFTITTSQTVQVADEINDVPNPSSDYGLGGWFENDEALLIYDRYDIWKIDPKNTKAPVNLTQNGRDKQLSYRVVRLDGEGGFRRFGGDEKGLDPSEPLFLSAHNEATRQDGYFTLDIKKKGSPKELLYGDFSLNRPEKAKDAAVIVFTKEDFETYPDLIVTDLSFRNLKQISDAAPQQKDFSWGTVELVSWTSLDGRKIEGTLHKPENFDPGKKYPLLVNFYEKSSQGLFNYRMPELHRSSIDYHYYTSNGYLVFNPDIYYKEGYPGEDAFNCVMPGVTALMEKGFVDEKRIGAQGHSWGGYQVAYLATRTNLFAAIESGAPVVNMFSAYGGIRWGSGLSRAFQYEHTQSRIGKSIWESPLRYLENSPIFTLDKVNTPILIMHNDDDGAVPWYQGIEFFIGLRRLQKPAWLLNYNEADHWPTKMVDKEDFQIRMAQFFDHYLKDKPMPKWMKDGIPAVDKGVDLGYELN